MEEGLWENRVGNDDIANTMSDFCGDFEDNDERGTPLDTRDPSSVALSPPGVAKAVSAAVCSAITHHEAQGGAAIEALVEPCAGDGRLTHAVRADFERRVGRAAPLSLFMCDMSPRGQYVKKCDAVGAKWLSSTGNSITSLGFGVAALVLNPPFNPTSVLQHIVSASLGIEGVEVCGLVLPGHYLDYRALHDLLPPFWHVTRCQRMDHQSFEQPELGVSSAAKGLTVAIVTAVRKAYPRQSPVRPLQVVPSQHGFQFVTQDDAWDHAFRVGTIRRPVEVIRADEKAESRSQNGKWLYVRYCMDELPGARGATAITYTDRERVVKCIQRLIECRTAYMSGPSHQRELGTAFPSSGTAGRFVVSQCTLTEWLFHVLHDDRNVFSGLSHTALLHRDDKEDEELMQSAQRCLEDIATTGALSDGEDDSFSESEEEPNVSREKSHLKWVQTLHLQCQNRAAESSLLDPLTQHTDGLLDYCGAIDAIAAQCEELKNDSLEDHLHLLKEVYCFDTSQQRVQRLDPEVLFRMRVLEGRTYAQLKERFRWTWKQIARHRIDSMKLTTKVESEAKRLQRYAMVHNLVLENQNLICAWGWHEQLAQKNKQFNLAVEEMNLDFGGPAPCVTMEGGSRKKPKSFKVLTVDFCLGRQQQQQSPPQHAGIDEEEEMMMRPLGKRDRPPSGFLIPASAKMLKATEDNE